MNTSLNIGTTNTKTQNGQSQIEADLQGLRQQIDQIDSELISVIAKRMEIVKQIGSYKQKHQINTVQPHRWQQILDNRKSNALQLKLDGQKVCDIFEVIHQMAIQIQRDNLPK